MSKDRLDIAITEMDDMVNVSHSLQRNHKSFKKLLSFPRLQNSDLKNMSFFYFSIPYCLSSIIFNGHL